MEREKEKINAKRANTTTLKQIPTFRIICSSPCYFSAIICWWNIRWNSIHMSIQHIPRSLKNHVANFAEAVEQLTSACAFSPLYGNFLYYFIKIISH